MKKVMFLLLAVLPFLAFSQKAKIEFETTSHNFGTISENGGKAIYDFAFKNIGNAPLILTNVRAGCGCTTPEWNRQPVAPGESGHIKVSYDPKNRPGSFVKSITVNSNAENSVISLTIRGNVSRKPVGPYDNYKYSIGQLKLTANNLNLGSLRNTEEVEKEIEIINSGSEPVNINVTSPDKYITATVTPSTLAKDQKGNVHITYSAPQKNDWGFVSDKINITVNGKEKGDIIVVANINEDFSQFQKDNFTQAPVASFEEKEFQLGDVPRNSTKTHEFYIQNTGKSDLIIRKLKPSDEMISVHTAKSVIKPGKKVKVTLTLKTDDSKGKRIKLIQFTMNDPKNPIVTYRLTANVQ